MSDPTAGAAAPAASSSSSSSSASTAGRKLTADERKNARARRVADKKQAASGGAAMDANASAAASSHARADDPATSVSKLHIRSARVEVDSAKSVAESMISDVVVERVHAENARRRAEAKAREERIERVERELENGTKINQEIEEAWPEVAKKDTPQDLYSSISAQYKLASGLLGVKDELILFLQGTLRKKDEEYVELLSTHQEDVNEVLGRMNSTFSAYLSTINTQLAGIESAFLAERETLLARHAAEVEAGFEKRRKMEVAIMESKGLRERRHAQELLELRSRDAEDYTALKVDLESSIALFEQQLEEMRATYQLNSEKLDYNHSVLVERDAENKATVEHHRQRLRKLKEALSAVVGKFQKSDAKFKSDNASLTAEYKRSTEQFKDLQRKYAHFVGVDTRQYAEVWSMNEEHVLLLARKVLRASQVIHEQVLGVQWRPPLLARDIRSVATGGAGGGYDVEKITSAMMYAAGQASAAAAAAAAASAASVASAGGSELSPSSPTKASTPASSGAGAGGAQSSPSSSPSPSDSSAASSASAAAAAAQASSGPPGPGGSRFTPQQVKLVLDLLVQEVAFLLDSGVRDTLSALVERGLEGESELYKADGVLSALGVEDREDLESLVGVFYDSPDATGANAGGESVRPTVHPNDVAKLVKEFVVKRQQVKTKAGSVAGLAMRAQPTDSVLSEKKARRKERERLFWWRLGHAISEPTLGVWSALERWQAQYNLLLEERAKLIDETTELAKQNEELKILLQEYLGSKVNQELEIPPTRLIRVNQQ